MVLDERSSSDTIPYIEIEEVRTTLAHEASVGRIGAEQLFYLMSRGLPMEYAVELNQLIQLEMEGSVG